MSPLPSFLIAASSFLVFLGLGIEWAKRTGDVR